MMDKNSVKKIFTGYRFSINVRFNDMDSYGIVHHGAYFSYFEEARCTFASEVLGIPYEMIEGQAIKFPVLEATCTYRNAVDYRDKELTVKLDFSILDDCKFYFKYELRNKENKVCARAETIHGILNNDKICLSIPEVLQEKIDRLLASQDKSV